MGTKTQTYIGKPVVTNAAVHAVVEEQVMHQIGYHPFIRIERGRRPKE